MASKRYYWIKLKDSFLTSETVDFLMSQPNGAEYVVLYQMLCLKTINNGGELASRIGEIIIPYDIIKIQRDTKHFKVDTIRVALELYKKLGLVYEQENGVLVIADFNKLVGSETTKAPLMRKSRAKKKLEKDGNNEVTMLPESYQNVTQEIRDKSIDIRDKDIKEKDIEKNKENIRAYALNLFLEFYDLYPRKVNRKKAEQKYVTLFKGLNKEKADKLHSEIMKGLKKYIEHIKANKTETSYIAHPTTWLNGERWADDYKVNKAIDDTPDFSEWQLPSFE